VAESQRPALWEYLRSAPEVLAAGEPVAAAPARLVSVDGQSPQDRIRTDRGEDERRFSRPEFSLTWARDMPPQTTLLLGRWWKGEPAPAEISVGQFAAEALQMKLGSRLVFQSGARKIEGVVSSVREIESIAPAGSNNQFIFSPGALQGLPQTYVGNVRAHPDGIPALQKALFEKFPTVTSIDVHDVLTLIRGLVDRIALVIQLVAGFAVAAGAVVLASGVVASRQRRLREAVLLKTLGATRRTVAVMHGVEFASIGLLAGLVGSLGATILTWLLLRRVFQTEFQFDWPSVLAATGATALLAVTSGWLAGLSIRRQKPIEILREV
jgi:putative ABC transport system permease protein